ncbi:DsbA family protein [Vibrio chagasii]|uniref:DsbA family protein n=1 Tax=Vibrio chagasii TaxID=170679 RepID=UPI003DA81965
MKFNTALLTALLSVTLVSSVFAKDTQEKVSEIVQILNENPNVVDALHENLESYVEYQAHFQDVLEKNHDYMYNNEVHSWFGSEDPTMTIVNFTDYSCPFCKKLDPVLEELAEKYPEIKVINIYVPLKERENNYNSAGFALNVWENSPENYEEVHEILVKKPGIHDERSLDRIAKKMGLEEHLEEGPMKKAILLKNYSLFMELGIRGTPGLLVGDEIIPGYMPFEKLEPIMLELMEKAKVKQKTEVK